MNGPDLFLIGHGSRDQAGIDEFWELARLVDKAVPDGTRTGHGFIELAEPHVDVAIDKLVADGATDIVAVPYVLFGAGHLKDDGPATLARARQRHPDVRFRLARDLGITPELLAVTEARVRAAPSTSRPGTRADPDRTAVVLVGRGSTDPDAVADVVKFARLLQDGRGLGEVHAAFVAMAPPDVPSALDRAHRLGATHIVVVPLFLFTGVLVGRIGRQAGAWAADHPDVGVSVAPHLGPDPALAQVVAGRFHEAVHDDVRMNCDVCAYRVRLPGYEEKVALPLPLAPHGDSEGGARGWRARRAAAKAERTAAEQRARPRRGLGRSLRLPPALDLDGHPAIEVDGLAFAYPDGRPALHGVDLTVVAGERLALLGPNGAGKTTLVLHLLGVLRPAAGSVKVAGLEVSDATVGAVRRTVGLVFQDPDDQLFSPTVADDVAFGPSNLGLTGDALQQRVTEALDAVGLLDLGGRPPHHLSVGERRRAALATVLAMHPKVLVLDEPTANLDPAARRDLADIVSGLDLTIVMVTHDLPYALELCPRSAVMDHGVVVADGPTPALLANRAHLAAHRLELPAGFHPR